MLAWTLLAVALLVPPASAQDPAPALEGAAAQMAARLDAAYAAWPSSAPGARLFVSDSFATPMAGGRSFRSLLMRGFLARRYTVLDVLPPGTTADLEVLGWLAVDPQKAFVEARLVDSRSRVLIGLETRTVPFTPPTPASSATAPAPPGPAGAPTAPGKRKFMVTAGISTNRNGWLAGAAYRPPSGRWEAGLEVGGLERKDRDAKYEFAATLPPTHIYTSFSYKAVYLEARGTYLHLLNMKYLTSLNAGFGTRVVFLKLRHDQAGGGRSTGTTESQRVMPVFSIGAAKDLWGDFEIQVGGEWTPVTRPINDLKLGGAAAKVLLGARLPL